MSEILDYSEYACTYRIPAGGMECAIDSAYGGAPRIYVERFDRLGKWFISNGPGNSLYLWLTKDGKWISMSSSSDRTDENYEATLYDTLDEAMEVAVAEYETGYDLYADFVRKRRERGHFTR